MHSRQLDHLRTAEQLMALDRGHAGGLLQILWQAPNDLPHQNRTLPCNLSPPLRLLQGSSSTLAGGGGKSVTSPLLHIFVRRADLNRAAFPDTASKKQTGSQLWMCRVAAHKLDCQSLIHILRIHFRPFLRHELDFREGGERQRTSLRCQ